MDLRQSFWPYQLFNYSLAFVRPTVVIAVIFKVLIHHLYIPNSLFLTPFVPEGNLLSVHSSI